MFLNIKEILKVTMILFAVIDIIGSIPVIISLKQRVGNINAVKASLWSLGIMVAFLFVGNSILEIIGIRIEDFAIAGSILIFIVAFEMLLGVQITKDQMPSTASVIPIAFPLIAGTGTLTTLLSIRAEYHLSSILIAIVINVILVYLVLKFIKKIENFLGAGGIAILKKVFGVILLAVAIKLFRKYTGL